MWLDVLPGNVPARRVQSLRRSAPDRFRSACAGHAAALPQQVYPPHPADVTGNLRAIHALLARLEPKGHRSVDPSPARRPDPAS